MKSRIDELLTLADAFCAAKRMSEARLSTILFNGGARLKQVRAGKDMGIKIAEEAIAWLSRNWPADAVWPTDIARPDGGPLAVPVISSSSCAVAGQEGTTDGVSEIANVGAEIANAHR